jgi:hypothetical protein
VSSENPSIEMSASQYGRNGFNPGYLHVKVHGNEMLLQTVPLCSFNFLLLAIIPPLLWTDLSVPPEMCNKPHQAVHYHILSFFKLGEFVSD